MIEGAIIQRLSSDEVDERMVEVFLRGIFISCTKI
ncbi:TetR family transcriptional regulator, partial [Acinetobacter baumannii]